MLIKVIYSFNYFNYFFICFDYEILSLLIFLIFFKYSISRWKRLFCIHNKLITESKNNFIKYYIFKLFNNNN